METFIPFSGPEKVSQSAHLTEAVGQGVVKRYLDNNQIDGALFKKGFPFIPTHANAEQRTQVQPQHV